VNDMEVAWEWHKSTTLQSHLFEDAIGYPREWLS